MKDRSQREQEILETLRNIGSEAEREDYLRGACGDDSELKESVRALYDAYQDESNFLDKLTVSGPENSERREGVPSERPGAVIGRYKLLQQIGVGGFGVVYMAEQSDPVRRRVALKIIKLGMDTEQVIARFEAERQALAMMDHPNIAKVHDAGATDSGCPYFVMELVKGVPINEYCDKNCLSLQERIELFLPVGRAIQHAHQKGVIHRDIKPPNVMVTLHDGQPVPKIIDFGIAKATNHRLTEKTLFTNFAQMLGTPAYMSPEQAEMSGLDVDTRTDVYSLGVLLYELLTGSTPFRTEDLLEKGFAEMQRVIREVDAEQPSTRMSTVQGEEMTVLAKHRSSRPETLSKVLKGDLDWIVMKALEKDRRRRYGTASELVADIERHLKNEPVLATPTSQVYRLRKFAQRHCAGVAAGLTLGATLILGITVSTWQWFRADRERERAEINEQKAIQSKEEETKQRRAAEKAQQQVGAERLKARRNAYASDMNLAFQALRENRLGRVRELLERHRQEPGEPDLRGWEWGHLWHESRSDELWSLEGHDDVVSCVAFSADGKVLASGSWDKTVRIWNVESRKQLTNLVHQGRVVDVVFSPDGKRLLTAENGSAETGPVVRSWAVDSWGEAVLAANEMPIGSLSLSSDGRFLAITDVFGNIAVRNLEITNDLPAMPIAQSSSHAAFAPEAPMLAVSDAGSIAFWNVEEQRKLRMIPFVSSSLHLLPTAFCSSGESLAIGGTRPQLLDLKEGEPPCALTNSMKEVRAITFSPSGAKLAGANSDNTISVWGAPAWNSEATLIGHRYSVTDLAFSPDGGLLVSSSADRTIKGWSPGALQERGAIRTMPGGISNMAFSLGEAILYLFEDNSLEIHMGPPEFKVIGKTLSFTPESWIYVSPGGHLICIRGKDGGHGVWDVGTMEQICIVPGDQIWIWAHRCFSPDETMLVGIDTDTDLRVVWNARNGGEIARLKVERSGMQWWCSDSNTIMINTPEGAHLWDVKRNVIRGFLRQEGGIRAAVMSRDGSRIATVGPHAVVKVWDARACSELGAFERGDLIAGGHTLHPFDFSADGRRLAVAAGQTDLKIYDLSTWRTVGSPNLNVTPSGCKFSEDGNWLTVGARTGTMDILIDLRATPVKECE